MTARERLKAWIDNHTDQRRFAAELGIDESMLSHYISGRRRPSSPTMGLIEDLTGIPMRSWLPTRVGKTADRTRNLGKSGKLGARNNHV